VGRTPWSASQPPIPPSPKGTVTRSGNLFSRLFKALQPFPTLQPQNRLLASNRGSSDVYSQKSTGPRTPHGRAASRFSAPAPPIPASASWRGAMPCEVRNPNNPNQLPDPQLRSAKILPASADPQPPYCPHGCPGRPRGSPIQFRSSQIDAARPIPRTGYQTIPNRRDSTCDRIRYLITGKVRPSPSDSASLASAARLKCNLQWSVDDCVSRPLTRRRRGSLLAAGRLRLSARQRPID
jgi:hypothetical protein